MIESDTGRPKAIIASRVLWVSGLVLAIVSCVYGSIAFLAIQESTPWISLWPMALSHLLCAFGMVTLLSGAIIRRSLASPTWSQELLWMAVWFACSGLASYNLALGMEDEGVYDAARKGMQLPWDLVMSGLGLAPVAWVMTAVLGLWGLCAKVKERRNRTSDIGFTGTSSQHPAAGSGRVLGAGARSRRNMILLGRCFWVGGLTITVINGSWSYFVYDRSDEYLPTPLDRLIGALGSITLIIGFIMIVVAFILRRVTRPQTGAHCTVWIALWCCLAGYATLYLAWVGFQANNLLPVRTTLSIIGSVLIGVGGLVALTAAAFTRSQLARASEHGGEPAVVGSRHN